MGRCKSQVAASYPTCITPLKKALEAGNLDRNPNSVTYGLSSIRKAIVLSEP